MTDTFNNESHLNSQSNLNFHPILYEEEIYEREQHSLANSENRIQIAIDDYIDPDLPITFKKQKKELDDVYQELKRKKEEERKSFGIPKKKEKKRGKKNGLEYKKYDRKKKKKKIKSDSRHVKGGWNTDVRTVGEFDNMRKNELAMDGVWKKRRYREQRKQRKKERGKKIPPLKKLNYFFF